VAGEPGGKALNLGGFAGAVEAFEGDENAAFGHGSSVAKERLTVRGQISGNEERHGWRDGDIGRLIGVRMPSSSPALRPSVSISIAVFTLYPRPEFSPAPLIVPIDCQTF